MRLARVTLIATAATAACALLDSNPEIAVRLESAIVLSSDSGTVVAIHYSITNTSDREIRFGGCCYQATLAASETDARADSQCRPSGPCQAIPCPGPLSSISPGQEVCRNDQFRVTKPGKYRLGVRYHSSTGESCWTWSRQFSLAWGAV